MIRILADHGLEVVADDAQSGTIVEDARRLGPDAIVLSLGGWVSTELRDQVRAAAPRAKVILWSRDETEMHIFDPGSPSARRVDVGGPGALVSELEAGQASRGGQ